MTYQKGFSSRLPYDNCAYAQDLSQSVSPFAYQMYDGKFENCNKCIYEKFYRPTDGDVVDAESELRNITRRSSKCDVAKYNPNCKKSKSCTNTFDPSVPVVLAPEVCPIVFNNLNWNGGNGYRKVQMSQCTGRPVGNQK